MKFYGPGENQFTNQEGSSLHRSLLNLAFFFFATLVLLYFCFYPAIWTGFAHHDDLGIFGPDWTQNLIYHETALGRAFFAIFDDLFAFPFVHSLSDVSYVRVIIVVLLSVSASIFAYHLYRIGLDRFLSFALSSLVFLLPGTQQRVFHAIALAPVIAILFAISAGIVFSNLPLSPKYWKRRAWTGFILLLMLLTVSAYTYIPSTMFFLVVSAGDFLFKKYATFKDRAISFITGNIFLPLWIVFTLILHKIIILPLLVKFNTIFSQRYGSGYKIALSHHIFLRVHSFITNWLPYELKLWFLEWKNAHIIIGLILFTLTTALITKNYLIKKEQTDLTPIQIGLSFSLLFYTVIFMNSPSFVSDSGGAFTRVMLSSSAIIAMVLFWCLYKILGNSWTMNSTALLLLILGFSVAHERFDKAVNIMNTEYNLVREAAQQVRENPDPFKEIVVISPTPGISYFGNNFFKDEFNSLNSHNRGEILSMFHIILDGQISVELNNGVGGVTTKFHISPDEYSEIHFVWDPQYFQTWYNSDDLWYVYGDHNNRMGERRAFICDTDDVFLIYTHAIIINFAQKSLYRNPLDACQPHFIRVNRDSVTKTIQTIGKGQRVRLDFLLLPGTNTMGILSKRNFALQYNNNHFYALSSRLGNFYIKNESKQNIARCLKDKTCFASDSIAQLEGDLQSATHGTTIRYP
jgi:hypothetical protein